MKIVLTINTRVNQSAEVKYFSLVTLLIICIIFVKLFLMTFVWLLDNDNDWKMLQEHSLAIILSVSDIWVWG